MSAGAVARPARVAATLLVLLLAVPFAAAAEGPQLPLPPCAPGLTRDARGICTGWLMVPGSALPVAGFALTTLPDGRLALLGGQEEGRGTVVHARAFDPTAESWLPLPALPAPRTEASASLLEDGRVLLAGGSDGRQPLDSAALLPPSGSAWLQAGKLTRPRRRHQAIELPGSRALIFGGTDGAGAALPGGDIFAPAAPTQLWSSLPAPWDGWTIAAAVGLDTGEVLLLGAMTPPAAAILDPALRQGRSLPPPPGLCRIAAAARLGADRILVLGENETTSPVGVLLDTVRGRWEPAPPLLRPFARYKVLTIRGGQVAVVGVEAAAPARPQLQLLRPGETSWEVGPAPTRLSFPLQLLPMTSGRTFATDGSRAEILVR